MSYLNHNLPDWSCYIRKQGHEEVTKCDVHLFKVETSNHYMYDIKE